MVSLQKTWSDEACDTFKELVEHKLISVVAKRNFTSTDIKTRGVTVQITKVFFFFFLGSYFRYGSVCAMFREKYYCQIKIKKI